MKTWIYRVVAEFTHTLIKICKARMRDVREVRWDLWMCSFDNYKPWNWIPIQILKHVFKFVSISKSSFDRLNVNGKERS